MGRLDDVGTICAISHSIDNGIRFFSETTNKPSWYVEEVGIGVNQRKNPNPEFMALLLNIQSRLDEQAIVMQQQVEMIQSLQQRQSKVVGPGLEGPEGGNPSMDLGNIGNGDNDHRVIGVGDPPIGAPRGVDMRLEGRPQL